MEQILRVNLQTYNGYKTLDVDCTVRADASGIIIAVDGYEELSCVFEYYEDQLHLLVWDENTIDGDCRRVVIAKDLVKAKKKIDAFYEDKS